MSELFEVTGFTVLMASVATLVMLPPGICVGWLLARRQFYGRSVLETVVTLPLVVPPVATGLILLKLLGRRGWLGGVMDSVGVDIVFTWKAVVVAMAVMGFPLLVRSARAGFEAVDRRYEGVAATLGASPVKVFLTISLPLARRGILAGAVLGVAIYRHAELGQDAAAAVLIIAAVAIGFVAVHVANRLGVAT